jgi:hypothetical protein
VATAFDGRGPVSWSALWHHLQGIVPLERRAFVMNSDSRNCYFCRFFNCSTISTRLVEG